MNPVPWHLLPDNSTVNDAGNLEIGGCDIVELAAEFGTPLFVYDENHLRARCRSVVEAFGPHAMYASKAFLCKAMAQLAYEEGMGIDVASGGELHIVLAAGVPADRIVMHGNNKSIEELKAARVAGVGRIVVDNFDELERLETLHAADGISPKILLRVAPGVKAETHKFVSTGQDDSKFGFTVSSGLASKAVEQASASKSVELVGIHAHVGSQVFRVDSFEAVVRVLGEFTKPLGLPELVVGGGLGVPYVAGEEAPTISQWCLVLKNAIKEAGIKAAVGIEPGRSIVAGASVTCYEVGGLKEIIGTRTYLAVNGGFNENPRPILYGSGYEALLARAPKADRTKTVRVVGHSCESSDVLLEAGMVPQDIKVGDVLVTPVTGAYGYSMGSNFNGFRRPPVIFAANGDARQVVRRETFDDLLRADMG